MKKILTIATIILLALSIPTYAFFNSDVKKAKDFIKAGMYPQAIELLDKRINDKPTDAEAHFVLGTCYLRQGNVGNADQRFESAANLESKYVSKAATEYERAGNSSLDKANYKRAKHMYSRAIQYNPELQEQIAKKCFDQGTASLSKPHFDMAMRFDSSYKMKAYNVIMDKADAASDDACLKLYDMAAGYCGKECERTQKAGERLEQIANKLEQINIFDARVKQYLDHAKSLNDNVRIYTDVIAIGKVKQFKVAKGRYSDKWSVIPNETTFYFLYNDLNFDIVYPNGTSTKVRKKTDIPKRLVRPFRIFAPIGDVGIAIEVKERN